MNSFKQTEQSKVRRLAERGKYDHETVYSILDEGFICHVGFVASDGRPVVIPTAYGRDGERVYIHGSAGSRMQRMLATGIDVSITVTLVDGLVLARSGFNSSINYRSVVIMGKANPVTDLEEKARALYLFSEHLLPGRWDEIRGPSEKELKQTSVLVIDLDEVSAKVRGGPPHDDEEDYALPVWAGVLPMEVKFGEPEPDPQLADGARVPEYVRKASRKRNHEDTKARS
jgi:nitroimidazol reductase NimA-like FMN-containing flavoprotein (pyridoxamine 5'-phosphate oxidase superfamily)